MRTNRSARRTAAPQAPPLDPGLQHLPGAATCRLAGLLACVPPVPPLPTGTTAASYGLAYLRGAGPGVGLRLLHPPNAKEIARGRYARHPPLGPENLSHAGLSPRAHRPSRGPAPNRPRPSAPPLTRPHLGRNRAPPAGVCGVESDGRATPPRLIAQKAGTPREVTSRPFRILLGLQDELGGRNLGPPPSRGAPPLGLGRQRGAALFPGPQLWAPLMPGLSSFPVLGPRPLFRQPPTQGTECRNRQRALRSTWPGALQVQDWE